MFICRPCIKIPNHRGHGVEQKATSNTHFKYETHFSTNSFPYCKITEILQIKTEECLLCKENTALY